MKLVFCFLAMLCIFRAPGQSLTVGDRVPESVMRQISKQLHLPVEGTSIQPVILLDFFATWCGSCIGFLPRLEELKTRMKDSVAVLVVSTQATREIGPLISARAPLLPFKGDDSILSALFPYRLLPHEVWIRNGVVQAITLPESIQPANVRILMANGNIDLPLKKDILVFDPTQPIADYFSDDQNTKGLWGRLNGAANTYGSHPIDGGHRRYFINQPLLTLYQHATGIPFNLFRYALRDSSWLDYHNQAIRVYCYEQFVPEGLDDKAAGKQMLGNLNRAGYLKGEVKSVMSDCYVITAIPGAAVSCLNHGAPRKVSYDSGRRNKTFTNLPLSRIIGEYTGAIIPSTDLPIVLDETGIIGNIDITIPVAALTDISLLAEALRPYGLTTSYTKRELQRLVITDQNRAYTPIIKPKQKPTL